MNTKALLDKSIVQSHRQCPRRAWLEANGSVEPRYTTAAEAMLEQGKRVHAVARAGFAGAVAIPSELRLDDAATRTALEIISGTTRMVEAAFVGGHMGVRVDLLECAADGAVVTEVKSGGSLKDTYIDDAAIQFHCLERAGVKIKGFRIAHPSTQRVLVEGESPASVLVHEDVTDTVRWRALGVVAWIEDCARTLSGDEPQCKPGAQCDDPNPCPFAHHCGEVPKRMEVDSVDYLPSKSGPVRDCMEGGITKVSELPPGAITHERNALVREAIVRGVPVVREHFARKLASLSYPRHFLDFEGAGLAIPRFSGMSPYQSLPFQWSCHTVASEDAEPSHAWFLDTSGNDPRRGFAESVIACVGDAGPVLVYSGYEANRLRELADLFPDLGESLRGIVARLVDLLPLARRGYYAPEQRGSWSIKAILPTLPGAAEAGLTYENLGEVNDGLSAQAAYMQLIDPSYIGPQKEALRQKLLDYCAIDTAGLLYFVRFVESHRPHALPMAA